MALNFEHITQWQTMRIVAANDTPLTLYAPADIVAAVKPKMTKVSPATMIMIQPLVLGDNNGTFVLTLSGWMDHGKNDPRHGGVGPGMRLYSGTLVAGNRAWTSDTPHNDGKWDTGAWRIVDTIPDDVDSMSEAFSIVDVDQDGLLFLPTLNYSYILVEVSALTNVTKVGLLWRPIGFSGIVKTDYMRFVPAS